MTAIQSNGWNDYKYVKNHEVLALMNTWRSATLEEKMSIEDLLIKRLSYLVCSKIKRYKGRSFYADLLQEGKLGLMKAIYQFDSTRSPNFFKFAVWKIQTSISGYINWYSKINREITETKFCNPCLENNDPCEQYEKQQRHQILLDAISRLPKIDQTVVLMRFGFGGDVPRTFQQIGDVFSLSRQRIEQINSRALSNLKKDQKVCDIFGYLGGDRNNARADLPER